MRRRGLLGAAAGVAVASGCAVVGPSPLEIVVAWSDSELDTFRSTVRAVVRRTGIPADVVVAEGNGVGATLTARLNAGNPPDLVVFSEPGLIDRYRHHLAPLPHDPVDDVPRYWNDLATRDGRLYGYWLKVAHKSLLWHRPHAVPALARWTDLMDLPAEALLSIGGADGWVLTDWFENVLAAITTPDEYEGLAAGTVGWSIRPVRDALGMLGDLWSRPHVFPYDAQRVLLTTFDASVVDVFGTGRARMLLEGDFVAPVVAGLGVHPVPAMVQRFPSVDGHRPLLVGGDLIARVSGSGPHAQTFLTHLVDPETRRPWARNGFLVPSTDIHDYGTALSRRLAAELTAGGAAIRFDLSDRLGGGLAGSDGTGSWLVMQQFFRDVVNGVAPRRAVHDAVAGFERAARSPA